MSTLETLPSVQDCLKQAGLNANKALGQHFLFDLNLTRKIARSVGISQDDLVIEIGPGPGGLTRPLLEQGVHVIAIDKDTRFTPILDDIRAASENRLEVHFEDALRSDLSRFASADRPIKIVSNLPYNIGTQLLIGWLTTKPIFWSSLTLMFQKEVAERVVALPGTTGYGRLAVLCAAVADAHMLFGVPAEAFTPPPKVDSAVVHLTPKREAERFADLEALEQITRAAFGQRRKMLRASLKTLAKPAKMNVADWLDEAGIDPTVRPETLAPQDFFALARLWRAATL
ncbi:MAG: 16S rRNA (adenine(1518)-N(6)/adenine(1519)-N(6))-dimethyltransferase [Robiginitomaculum sp.]|nr:MAG: 16S rRNA (adenine(1518)-N(6)/adenine(1519)-N(6))-dimethyltransferase [Robiginitomaculum sp.]